MTVHSFLGEGRNKKKSKRTNRAGQTKLENERRFIEHVILDEMSMVGLSLLAWLSNIIATAKQADPIVPIGGVNYEQYSQWNQKSARVLVLQINLCCHNSTRDENNR